MSDEINPELESFRKQWQEEVSTRSKGSSSGQSTRPPPKSGISIRNEPPPPPHSNEVHKASEAQIYHDLEDKDEARNLGEEVGGTYPSYYVNLEPSSALEHYEKAVERESQGNLGDSLALYRKAYRLDPGVDRIYKNKHFPPSSFKSKQTNRNPSNVPVTVPNPAHHSLDGSPQSSLPDLIASFSSLSIAPAAPPTEGSHTPRSPVSTIPSELLVEVLERTALTDIASFARLPLVCKHLAYLIAVEDRLWKGVCLGSDQGFGAMHYDWNCTISGDPLPFTDDHLPSKDTEDSTSSSRPISPNALFALTPLYPSYKTMFQFRPRIRFGGCYISTVNYIRPGASTPSQISWNNPVHIVTYYRYLRFFRDGSCISLLTTTEPIDVVHHLTKEHLHNHHAGGLSTAVMNHALRGRWKLSSPEETEKEGTLHIETYGIDPEKYIYKMQLYLRSGRSKGGGTRNNKLVWDGFWSYNKLTDDWAEFGLRNDRPFWWSRVGSYAGGG